jgi:tetratricopeptide (TPR) repeat protein
MSKIEMGTLEGLALHLAPPLHPATPSLRSASPCPPAMVRRQLSWRATHALHGILALATLAVCVAAPAVAQAQSEAEKRVQAKDHYEMATRLYDVGKYGEAIAEYEQAYLLIEDAALLFNIGQAYRLWDRPEDAIRAYKNYLRRRPEASNRSDVEKKIADLERIVEERRRGVPAQPPPQSVQPAQQVPPPVPAAYPAYSGPAPVPGTPAQLAPAAAPMPEQQPDSVTFAQPAQAEPASSKKTWIAYSLLGVGGACLVTTFIAAAVGASKAKKLQDASQNRQPFDPAVEANGKTANTVAVVSVLAAIATGGAGGYLLWRWRGSAAPSVAVVPVAGLTFAGGSALLTF